MPGNSTPGLEPIILILLCLQLVCVAHFGCVVGIRKKLLKKKYEQLIVEVWAADCNHVGCEEQAGPTLGSTALDVLCPASWVSHDGQKTCKRISLSGFWAQQFPDPVPGRDTQGRGKEYRALLSVAFAFLNR